MKRFAFAWLLISLGALLAAGGCRAQFPAAPGTGPGLPETVEAIESARVTTRILYITAHPDDESAAVLTYLARGLHADVALLSLTRGEGGQNALGPEQAPQLGLIRTQELLAATRGYGVKLYFTRARDFGFSKTPEETEKIWGDEVVEDMVRVIRSFRPTIVINNWGGVHSGHGHHQASGILTPKAVRLAADETIYPELRQENLPPWNGGNEPVQILDLDRGGGDAGGYTLPLDEVSPLYGKSYRQIGIDAFVNHRTQGISGFISSPFLRRPIALLREDGKPFDRSTLASPLRELFGPPNGTVCAAHPGWCEALQSADRKLGEARAAALALDWQAATNSIAAAEKALDSLHPSDATPSPGPPGPAQAADIARQIDRVVRALCLAAGLELGAEADRSTIVRGEPFTVTVTYRCRPKLDCPVAGAPEVWAGTARFASDGGEPQTGSKFTGSVDASQARLSILDQLNAEPRSVVNATVSETAGSSAGHPITIPVTHIEASSTSVVRVPLAIVPAYTLSVEPDQAVEVLGAPRLPFDVLLRVHSYSIQAAKVKAGLEAPGGFRSSAPVELDFAGPGDQYAKITVTPPASLAAGNSPLIAFVERGEQKFSTSLEPLPSMPTILWSKPAQCLVHAFDINVPANLRVGYVSAESEPVPDALKRLGIEVRMLDANALNFGELSGFDAIVVGVRAYELRPELPGANKRLLAYVQQGGTLVVQYNRDFAWDKLQPAPYPATIGNPTPRITDERAAVEFLQPADPLLNAPNRIRAADFDGWVQERGLYFWGEFDARYTALLSMKDPGESALKGGLVYTRYGKGVYIYTGLAFFRELPEGVPGAYRLFVNLLSASRTVLASAQAAH